MQAVVVLQAKSGRLLFHKAYKPGALAFDSDSSGLNGRKGSHQQQGMMLAPFLCALWTNTKDLMCKPPQAGQGQMIQDSEDQQINQEQEEASSCSFHTGKVWLHFAHDPAHDVLVVTFLDSVLTHTGDWLAAEVCQAFAGKFGDVRKIERVTTATFSSFEDTLRQDISERWIQYVAEETFQGLHPSDQPPWVYVLVSPELGAELDSGRTFSQDDHRRASPAAAQPEALATPMETGNKYPFAPRKKRWWQRGSETLRASKGEVVRLPGLQGKDSLPDSKLTHRLAEVCRGAGRVLSTPDEVNDQMASMQLTLERSVLPPGVARWSVAAAELSEPKRLWVIRCGDVVLAFPGASSGGGVGSGGGSRSSDENREKSGGDTQEILTLADVERLIRPRARGLAVAAEWRELPNPS